MSSAKVRNSRLDDILNTSNFDLDTSGIHRGRVIDNRDPDKLGRVQLRINSLHGLPGTSETYLLDSELPWALPGVMSATGNDVGQFLVPIVGTVVWVMFEGGDLDRVVYLGGVVSKIGKVKNYNSNNDYVLSGKVEVTTDDYPPEVYDPASSGIIFKSLKGATIKYQDFDGQESLQVIGQAGQIISIESAEEVTSRRGSRVLHKKGRVKIIASGNTGDIISHGGVVHIRDFNSINDE